MGISNHPGKDRKHAAPHGNAFACAAAWFLVTVASFFATFAVSRLLPSSEKTEFAVTILPEAGATRLEDRDVTDIRIFYATEDDPVFSDRLKLTKDEILSRGSELVERKHIVNLPNDITGIRVDVALAVDADGVHIGQSDMPYGIARRLLGPDKIIGLSVETMEEVVEANGLDVDYVAVSPVFATHTKTDTLTPFGYEGLERACRLTRHPVCGIGGMNADTVGRAIACGADGVAVVSAISSAPDPCLASKNLKSIIDNELDKRRMG